MIWVKGFLIFTKAKNSNHSFCEIHQLRGVISRRHLRSFVISEKSSWKECNVDLYTRRSKFSTPCLYKITKFLSLAWNPSQPLLPELYFVNLPCTIVSVGYVFHKKAFFIITDQLLPKKIMKYLFAHKAHYIFSKFKCKISFLYML